MKSPSTGKTIDGLAPGLPAAQAARITLRARLRAVESMLAEATGDGAMDEKIVHRLRVSTRRAAAAIRAYKAWTPKKDRRALRKALRRVRRAAAAARLADVHAHAFERLARDADPSLAAPIGVVLGRIVEQRREAGRVVRRLSDDPRSGRDAIRRLRRRLVGAVGDADRDATLMDVASAQLRQLAGRFEEAGRADLSLIEHVHELRIAGKRLRYAVELFECCFPPDAHQALLDRLTRFQDRLGDINDLCDMRARVRANADDASLSAGVRDGLESLVADLSARLDRAHGAFLEWWGAQGIASIFHALPMPGRPAPGAPSDRAEQNGDLGTTMDRLIRDTVRHLA